MTAPGGPSLARVTVVAPTEHLKHQWADAAALEVLEYAGRRWAEQGSPILVLIADRPEELGGTSSIKRWLPSLGRRMPARSLTLPPLRNEDVQGLLRHLTRVEEEEEELFPKLERKLGARIGHRLAAIVGAVGGLQDECGKRIRRAAPASRASPSPATTA